jgi:hypothetical protein
MSIGVFSAAAVTYGVISAAHRGPLQGLGPAGQDHEALLTWSGWA